MGVANTNITSQWEEGYRRLRDTAEIAVNSARNLVSRANGMHLELFSEIQTVELIQRCEISSYHGGDYEVQICLLGCTAV
jgi:hypothetical protein